MTVARAPRESLGSHPRLSQDSLPGVSDGKSS